MLRLCRMARAWACYHAIGWRRLHTDRVLAWAGDWAYRAECRAAGLDPWGPR